MMRLSAILAIALVQSAAGQRSGRPQRDCSTHDSSPEWSQKLLDGGKVRFTIDAAGIGTCVEYYDIEFVAQLLSASGAILATKRFAAVNVTLASPTIISLDFVLGVASVAKVNGLSMNCKKRLFGGLPGPPKEDTGSGPNIGDLIEKSFQKERRSYDDWHVGYEADYSESIFPNSDELACSAGQLKDTGKVGDSAACAEVKRAAAQAIKARQEKLGEPIMPIGPPKSF